MMVCTWCRGKVYIGDTKYGSVIWKGPHMWSRMDALLTYLVNLSLPCISVELPDASLPSFSEPLLSPLP